MPSTRRRTLIPTNVELGTPIAGRCSVCNTPFEISFGSMESLSHAHDRLLTQFNEHICHEDADQAAARIVRKTTADK
jgi:hypothetical protein